VSVVGEAAGAAEVSRSVKPLIICVLRFGGTPKRCLFEIVRSGSPRQARRSDMTHSVMEWAGLAADRTLSPGGRWL